MDDMMDRLMLGLDKRKEIFDLWLQVECLRLSINKILDRNPEIKEKMNEEDFKECLDQAKIYVETRFPACQFLFDKTKEVSQEADSSQTSL